MLYEVITNAITDEEEKYDRLVELNVQEQCVNLIKTAVITSYSIHYTKLYEVKNVEFTNKVSNEN